MSADFRPTLGTYTELRPFRFWCQQVLPMVYDDTLTNIENLCKIVDYLNKTMADVDTAVQDVVKLNTTYGQLEDYVNTYYENLDVQEEINKKLDEMALDGTLNALIVPHLPQLISDWLQNNVTPTSPIVDKTLTIGEAAADSKVTGEFVGGNAPYNAALFAPSSVEGNNFKLYDGSNNAGIESRVNPSKKIVIPNFAGVTPTYAQGFIISIDSKYHKTVVNNQEINITVWVKLKTEGVLTNFRVMLINMITAWGGRNDLVQATADFSVMYSGAYTLSSTVQVGSTASVLSLNHMVFRALTSSAYNVEEISYLPFDYENNFYKDYVITSANIDKLKSPFEVALLAPESVPGDNFNFFSGETNAAAFSRIEQAKLFTVPDFSQYPRNYAQGFIVSMESKYYRPVQNGSDVKVTVYIGLKEEGVSTSVRVMLTNILTAWGGSSNLIVVTVDFNIMYSGVYTLIGKAVANASATDLNLKFFAFRAMYESAYNVEKIAYLPFGDFTENTLGTDTPSTEIIFWGDSLTAGAGGSGFNFPKTCCEILKKSWINAGVGGETANTIACRQGGSNVIIPPGNINGSYNIGILKDTFGGTVGVLRQGTGSNTGNKIYINNQLCDISIQQSSTTSGDAVYTISGYTGEATKFPVEGRFIGDDIKGEVTVIFVGQNGAFIDTTNDITARIAIIDSMVKNLNNDKYVVMGLTTGTRSGNENDELQLLEKYGNKFFNSRELLSQYGMQIVGATPTESDNTDIANGKVPASLMSDTIHLNTNGYIALGTLVASKITSLGYF